MALLTRPTPAERSRTVYLRVNRNTRTAEFEGVRGIYPGDKLIVTVTDINGIDPDDVELIIWKKEAGQTLQSSLAYATGFAAPAGASSTVSKDITFDSENLITALSATPLGTAYVARLILRSAGMPFIDQDIELYGNPDFTASPPTQPEDVVANPFVRRNHLRQWALDALNPEAAGYLPLDTPDDMAAAIQAILTKLSDVTA